MKIEQKKKTLVSSQNFKSEGFTIDQAEIGFVINMLRNKLYSDKMLAPIREYTTNAVDAHTDAGCRDKPIEVSLPSTFDPVFKVRDFGEGLSEEQIYDIYIKYCKSTKRQSNDGIGGLGIGCKSAFAYTDAFTVTSYYNGKKSVYNACLDEMDNGKMDKMAETDSQEPSGVEIKIAVKDCDIPSWRRKCLDLFSYFSVTPDVVNLDSDEKIKSFDDVLFSGEGWKLINDKNTYYYNSTNGCTLIMGGIPYKIDHNLVEGAKDHEKSVLQVTDLQIIAPIGAVDIAPSRESLEYTKKTILFLRKISNSIFEKLSDIASDKLKNAKDLWEAKQMHSEVMCSLPRSITSTYSSGFDWKGIKVTGNTFEIPRLNFSYDDQMEVRHYSLNDERIRSVSVRYFNASKDTKIFLNDCESSHGLSLRARTIFNENEDVKNIVLLTFRTHNAKKRFYKENDFHLVSKKRIGSFSAVEKAKAIRTSSGIKTTRSNTKVFVYSAKLNGSPSDRWENASIDLEDGGVYVPIFKFKALKDEENVDSAIDFGLMNKVLSAIEKFTDKKITVYGIRKGDCKKLDKKKWKTLSDHVETAWAKAKKDKSLLQMFKDYKQEKSCIEKPELESCSSVRKVVLGLLKSNKINNSIRELLEEKNKFENEHSCEEFLEKKDYLIFMSNFLDKDTKSLTVNIKARYKLNEHRQAIKKDYPMLSLMSFYSDWQFRRGNQERLFVEYVKQMDELKVCRTQK